MFERRGNNYVFNCKISEVPCIQDVISTQMLYQHDSLSRESLFNWRPLPKRCVRCYLFNLSG